MAPAPVPETVLRKRRRDEEWAAKRAAAAAEVRAGTAGGGVAHARAAPGDRLGPPGARGGPSPLGTA
jgi:hypothetical protein